MPNVPEPPSPAGRIEWSRFDQPLADIEDFFDDVEPIVLQAIAEGMPEEESNALRAICCGIAAMAGTALLQIHAVQELMRQALTAYKRRGFATAEPKKEKPDAGPGERR